MGYTASHLIFRLAAPLDTNQAIKALGAVLGQTQARLLEQISVSSSRVVAPRQQSSHTRQNQPLKCSFCVTPILQCSHFLCANCSITSGTSKDGFILCPACEQHSLHCHDSSHFFIEVKRTSPDMDNKALIPLGERWEVLEITKSGPLLPPLYAEIDQQANTTPFSNGHSNGNMTFGDTHELSTGLRRGGTEARRRAQEIETQPKHLVSLESLVHP